jgi:hypothetical protein
LEIYEAQEGRIQAVGVGQKHCQRNVEVTHLGILVDNKAEG